MRDGVVNANRDRWFKFDGNRLGRMAGKQRQHINRCHRPVSHSDQQYTQVDERHADRSRIPINSTLKGTQTDLTKERLTILLHLPRVIIGYMGNPIIMVIGSDHWASVSDHWVRE